MSLRRLPQALILLAVATLASAPQLQAVGKQPWELTLDERIALRVHQNTDAPKNTMFSSDHRPVVVIDGRANPAAFMPSELFVTFIRMAYEGDAAACQRYRHAVEDTSVALGFGTSFWSQLRPIAKTMLQRSNEASAAARAPEASATEIASATRTACRAAADALRSACERFGEQPFLRLLYQAVAPDLSVTTDLADAAQLRSIEEGCQ